MLITGIHGKGTVVEENNYKYLDVLLLLEQYLTLFISNLPSIRTAL
jgi:hypothetical protein